MIQTRMTRTQQRYYRKKLFEQRLLALVILACCAVALWLCSTGTTIEDQDATAVVLLAPLGIYSLFTKKIMIY